MATSTHTAPKLPVINGMVPPSQNHNENNVFIFNELLKLYYRMPKSYSGAIAFLESIVPLLVKYKIASGPKVRKVPKSSDDGYDTYTLEFCDTTDTIPDEAVIGLADAIMDYYFSYKQIIPQLPVYHGDPPRTTKLSNYNTVLKRFIPYVFVPYHKSSEDDSDSDSDSDNDNDNDNDASTVETREAYEIIRPGLIDGDLPEEVSECRLRLKAAYSADFQGSRIEELLKCNTRLREAKSSYRFVPYYCLDETETQIETYDLVKTEPLPNTMMSKYDGVFSFQMSPYAPDEKFEDVKLTLGPLPKTMKY
jgi:hypothetical protein